mgnify:CR=1 FL=1
MLLREVIEGIRMGAKDLAIQPKKDYTIGFEFEVAVKDNYSRNFDSDDDFDDDEEESIEELFDEFSDLWYSGESTFDFEDWFNEFMRYNNGLETVRDNVEPRYGAVDDPDAIKEYLLSELQQDHQRAKDRVKDMFDEDVVKKISDFAKQFPDVDSIESADESTLQSLIRFVYTDIKNYSEYQTDEQWQALFQEMPRERLETNATSALNTIQFYSEGLNKKPPSIDDIDDDDIDEERYIYGDADQTVIVDTEEDINDLEDVLQYYDTDTEELRDITDNDWSDAENEEMMRAFDDWLNSNRSGNTGKISYVKSQLKDIRKPDWRVVEDGTPGVDAEIVTGIMDIDEGIESVKSVFDMINSDENLFTKSGTGLHINIGSWRGNDWNQVDWLKFLIVYRADRALSAFERQFNTYASDQLPRIIDDLEANSLEAFYDNIDTVNSVVRKLSTKMSAVNLSKLPTRGHIEIRAPGGTEYHKKTDEVINQIRRAVRALEIASDPDAYKNQYIKKLHKMLGKRKNVGTPVERFFREFGIKDYHSNDILDILITAMRVSERVDIDRIDKIYNMSIHKQIVNDLKRLGNTQNVSTLLRRGLEKYDTNGKLSQSRFIKYILSAFPGTKPAVPTSQKGTPGEIRSF